MKLIVAFVILAVASSALSDNFNCPEPERAKSLVYNEEISENAPAVGRIEKNITIQAEKISCVSVAGYFSGQPYGKASAISFGFSEDGVNVKLLSQIKGGLTVDVEAFSEEAQ